VHAAYALLRMNGQRGDLFKGGEITSLETAINRVGANSQQFDALLIVLSNMVKSRTDIAGERTVAILEGALNKRGKETDVYVEAAVALRHIAEKKTELITENTISVIGGMPDLIGTESRLHSKMSRVLGSETKLYSLLACIISHVAEKRSELITESIVAKLEQFLLNADDEEYEDATLYWTAGAALSLISVKRPDLSKITDLNDVYHRVRQFKSERKEKWEAFVSENILMLPSMIKTIKDTSWSLVAGNIDDGTGLRLKGDEVKKLISDATEGQDLLAVRIKQRAYRKYMLKKEGIDLPEYEIDEEKLNLYLPVYKYGWEEFLLFMNENYDEFHLRSYRFSGEGIEEAFQTTDASTLEGIGEIDLLSGDEEFKPCILCGNIHGLYIRRKDGSKTIYVNRNDLDVYIGDFRKSLGKDVTAGQIAKFLDGHETFHALVDKLRLDGTLLEEIDEDEEERMADIFGKAFMSIVPDDDIAISDWDVPADLKDEFQEIEEAINLDLVDILKKRPARVEGLLEGLGIDIEIEIKTSDEMRIIKEAADRASEVVKASETYKDPKEGVLETIVGIKNGTIDILQSSVVAALEKVLNIEGFESDTYEWAAFTLSKIAGGNIALIRPDTVRVLEKLLNAEGLKSTPYHTGAIAVLQIVLGNIGLIQISTVKALGKILNAEGLESVVYKWSAYAVSQIADRNIELIRSGTVEALEKVLNTEGLRNNVYKRGAFALYRIADGKIGLIRPGTVEALEKVLTRGDPKNNAYSDGSRALAKIVDRDIELIRSGTVEALEKVLNTEGLNGQIYGEAAYTLSQIAGKKCGLIRASTARALERVLNVEGLGDNAYEWSAFTLSQIAVGNIALIRSSTVEALEKVLNTDGLERNAYHMGSIALMQIAARKIALIRQNTVKALEKILNTEGLENLVYKWAARALYQIASGNIDLMSPETVKTLEKTLNTEGLETAVYYPVAIVLTKIATGRIELIEPSTVETLEKTLNTENRESHIYGQASYALSQIAYGKIALIQPSTVTALKNILRQSERGSDDALYLASGVTLSLISSKRDDLPEIVEFDEIYEKVRKSGTCRETIDKVMRYMVITPAMISTIEAHPAAVILSDIGDNSDIKFDEDIENIFFGEVEGQTLIAINMKQRIYCDHAEVSGKPRPSKYNIYPQKINFYTAIYKLPWKDFVTFMDENYDEFHETPEKFIGGEIETIIQTGDASTLDGLEEIDLFGDDQDLRACVLCGNIHGLYRRRKDGSKTIYVNRDRLEAYLDEFTELLGDDVTAEEAAKFLDGHETFHALMDKLRLEGHALEEIYHYEEERLADIFGKAFMMAASDDEFISGEHVVPVDLRDELEAIERKINVGLIDVLEKRPAKIEEVLDGLGIELDIVVKLPYQIEYIKNSIKAGVEVDEVVDLDILKDILVEITGYHDPGLVSKELRDIAKRKCGDIHESTVRGLEEILTMEGWADKYYRAAAYALEQVIEEDEKFIKERTVRALEVVLNRDALPGDIYNLAALGLWQAACKKSYHIDQMTTAALGAVLKRDGIERYVQVRVMGVLVQIAGERSDNIRSDQIRMMEDILSSEPIDNDMVAQSADVLGRISVLRSNHIRAGTVSVLEDLLERGELDKIAYGKVAYALAQISMRNVNSVNEGTVKSLENILNREDLAAADYEIPAQAVETIARERPELIDENTLYAVENVLKREGMKDEACNRAAQAVKSIAKERISFIRQETVIILEDVLKRRSRQDFVYTSAASALEGITSAAGRLIRPETVTVLEYMLERDDFGSPPYEMAASVLRYIAEFRSELIMPDTVRALESILLDDNWVLVDVYGEMSYALGKIAEKRSDLIQLSSFQQIFQNPSILRPWADRHYQKGAY